jgi:glutathione synthase/RimK-type ligase-like ATP-grasp enzyme
LDTIQDNTLCALFVDFLDEDREISLLLNQTTKQRIQIIKKLRYTRSEYYKMLVNQHVDFVHLQNKNELALKPELPLNLILLRQAALDLGLKVTSDNWVNNIRVFKPGSTTESILFQRSVTGLNGQDASQISKDKAWTYKLLLDKVAMPYTLSFLNPAVNETYKNYLIYDSIEDIMNKIAFDPELTYPMIIKMNGGTQGQHVYICRNSEDVIMALNTIFNDGHMLVLAQEMIDIAHEYRAVSYNGQVLLVYEKVLPATADVHSEDNISPLHIEGTTALHITDLSLIRRFEKFIAPVQAITNLNFGGFDIVSNSSEKLYMIEQNSAPGFDYFLRDNDPAILQEMYTLLLQISLLKV